LSAALALFGCGAGGSTPTGTGGTGSGGVGGAAGGSGGSAGNSGGAGGTGGPTDAGGMTDAGATGTGGAAAGFKLTSNTLAEGAMIPVDSTCETTMAASQMPDLHWTGAPAGTRSFAMAFVDVSLIPANANGYHSVLWDVPTSATMLPYGLPAGSPPAGVAGLENVKQKNPIRAAWLGPCPNLPSTTRTKTDNYEFRLYALSVDTLPSNITGMTVAGMVKAIEALPVLATAVLSGKSNAAAATLK
jgi:phosphatidylethanolamine-binding protein (PEBP) family uncharacterized protein